MREIRLAQLKQREERWRRLLIETGASELGEVRVQLLLWRSGHGQNSMVIDTHVHLGSTPSALRLAIWRLNEDFHAIMSIEGARVNVPAPVPPSLGRTIPQGIDTAGLSLWDGFVDTRADTWSGLLWECGLPKPYRASLINSDDDLRAAIQAERGSP